MKTRSMRAGVLGRMLGILALLLTLGLGWPIGAMALDAAVGTPGPLDPPDLSSPRATLATFTIEARAAIKSYTAGDSAAVREHAMRAFATFEGPPVTGETSFVAATETAIMLLEVLARIDLPRPAEIPDAAQVATLDLHSWTVPGTEITLATPADEPAGHAEFRFTEETVSRIPEFFHRVEDLPATGDLGTYYGIAERFRLGPGLEAPPAFTTFIQGLPNFWFIMLGELPIWKWTMLIALALLAFAVEALGYRLVAAGRRLDTSGRHDHWWGLVLPLLTLSLTVAVHYVAIEVIRLIGIPRAVIVTLTTIIGHLAFAWLIFQVLDSAAAVLIHMRDLGVASLDTQLVRLLFRLTSVVAGIYVLAIMAENLGLPVAPMLAGLGVGGLAVALAVRPTLENVIGGFVLFADKAVKVGEFCRFGDKMGTVEAVGLRSVRIRGIDRTLISLPNAEFCQMEIVNFTRRDQILLQSRIGLRYETSADQLRLVLVRLRELLLRHPKVSMDPARVRFVEYGESSLDLEIFAYVHTRDINEFLAIQEDIYLRIIDIVEAAGARFALPSQTLYLERATRADAERTTAAEAMVERWRKENRLPFPNHDEQYRFELASTLDYPPEGSPQVRSKRPRPA